MKKFKYHALLPLVTVLATGRGGDHYNTPIKKDITDLQANKYVTGVSPDG